jgi:hypothetical protein
MNIVQAWTKFNKQSIILISGFSGSHKTKLAKFVSDIFGFQILNLTKFFKTDDEYDLETNYVVLKDESKVLNWDNIYESIDWKKFNSYVNANKETGIIIHGFGFPSSLIDFVADFHIHIGISKQKLMENRREFVAKHSADIADTTDKIDENTTSESADEISPMEKLFFNTITYPIYIEINKESKFDLYVNSNELTDEQMKDKIFEFLIKSIQQKISQIDKPNRSNDSKSTASNNQSEAGNNMSIHYEDPENKINNFYYPNKKKNIYAFNDEGIDYPEEYLNKNRSSDTSDSSDSSDVFDSGINYEAQKHKIKKLSDSSGSTDSSGLIDSSDSTDSSDDANPVFLGTVRD